MRKIFLIIMLIILSGCQITGLVYEYAIKVEPPVNGEVEVLHQAAPNEIINIEAKAFAGYYLSAIYVNDELIEGTSFVMPNEVVEITVVFLPKENGYKIEISPEIINGQVEVINMAEANQRVDLEIIPHENYYVSAIYVNDELIKDNYFIMPSCDVLINVIFSLKKPEECLHRYSVKISMSATCMQDGWIIYECSECLDEYQIVTDMIQHQYHDGTCINCHLAADNVIFETFGNRVDIYNMTDENPYGINLNKYGNDVYAIFYQPQLINDLYLGVNKTSFYANYEAAKTYEEAYYRTQHFLMSGDITPQDEKAELGTKINGKYSKISTAFYILDFDGNYLGYLPNNANENDYIIYYGGAYTSLEDIAAYMQAFGNQPVNTDFNKSDKSSAVSLWGKYGRVNNGKFSANSSKYPYQPSLPSASYIESDFGHQGGFVINGIKQSVYNNGNGITRGTARFVYTKTSGIVSIDKRYVFYTYNHYNDFQEYLNYVDGWTNRFGNESAGNPYCSSSRDWNSSYNAPTQREEYIITRFNKYQKSI